MSTVMTKTAVSTEPERKAEKDLSKPGDSGSRDRRKATLYRMKTDEHICPFGLKTRDLLKREGFDLDDRLLTSRDEIDAFKAKHDVKTTPQVFLGDERNERIGGYEDLLRHLGKDVPDKTAKSYQPVIAIFATAALMALATAWAAFGDIMTVQTLEWFIAISMCILGIQKLQDLNSFSNMFLGYDLLAQRVVRYAYVYPFVEAGAGVLMIAGALTFLAAPAALFIGTIGAVSVFKAVYIDKRDLKCACAGGNNKVPLGFVSLTENLMMVGMAVWMLAK